MQERRITIILCEKEREALYELACLEKRDTRGQAAFLVHKELERLGLLSKSYKQIKKTALSLGQILEEVNSGR
jgi:hypothetical protein